MGKIARFFGFEAEEPATEQFSHYEPFPVPDGLPIAHNDPRIALLFSPAGVSREQAMKISAVAKGRNAICQIANLPLVTYGKDNEVKKNSLLTQIATGVPNVITLARTVDDLVFYGKSYWAIDLVNRRTLYPTKAHHIEYSRVTEQDGQFWIDGNRVDSDTIIKFESPNPALLEVMSDTVKRALLLAQTASTFARNPKPQLVVKPAAGEQVNKEAVKAAIDGIIEGSRNNAGVIGISSNLEIDSLSPMNPAELQLVELQKMVYIEIANFFGLEPDEVGVPIGSDTYKNAEERRIAFKTEVLQPYVNAIEQRLGMDDITPEGYVVKFNFDEFLRADAMQKAQVGQIEIGMGVTTADEYRASKGLPPLMTDTSNDTNSGGN